MRLFVALTPPAEPLAELERAVAPLRPNWPGLRWAAPAQWHVTVAFLGEVPEERLTGLRERLARAAARHRPVRLWLGAGGAFPSAAKARVLCVYIDGRAGDLTGLGRLAASVGAGARRAGAPPPDEGRPYRPHVTLARSKEPGNLSAAVRALSGFSGSAWIADQIHLVRSQTGPQPRHETIGTWHLRAAGPPGTN